MVVRLTRKEAGMNKTSIRALAVICFLCFFCCVEVSLALDQGKAGPEGSKFKTDFRFRKYVDEHGNQRPNPAPEQIYGPLYSVGPVDVCVYLLKTSEGLILFDAGYGTRDSSLIPDNIRKLGFDPSEIKKIFVTHWHGDHAGGATRIAALSGAETLMHRLDAEVVRTGFFQGRPAGQPYEKVKDLEDGQEFSFGDAVVKVIHTPGQSAGEVVYLVNVGGPQGPCRALVAGDATGFKADPEDFERMKYPGVCADYDRTVKVLKAIQFDLYLGGHPHQVFNEMREDGFPFVTREEWFKMVDNRYQQKVDFLKQHPEYANY